MASRKCAQPRNEGETEWFSLDLGYCKYARSEHIISTLHPLTPFWMLTLYVFG